MNTRQLWGMEEHEIQGARAIYGARKFFENKSYVVASDPTRSDCAARAERENDDNAILVAISL